MNFEMNYAEAERFGAFLVRSAFLAALLIAAWLLIDAACRDARSRRLVLAGDGEPMRPRAETRAMIVSSLHAATRAATAIRQTCGVDSDEYRDARRTLDRARKDFAAFVGAEREGGTDLLERRWKGREARRRPVGGEA